MTGPSYICDTWIKVHGSKRSDILEKLIEWSVTFYVEPLPDDMWLIAVKREALRKLEAAMAHADCGKIVFHKPAASEDFLGLITRYVWRKPELSDREIVEVIRFMPDVKATRDAWWEYAVKNNDQHLLSKLDGVEAKRKK